MILRESDAKTKWCPYAMVAEMKRDGATGPSYNRERGWKADLIPEFSRCLGRECMMWESISNMNEVEPKGYCGFRRPQTG